MLFPLYHVTFCAKDREARCHSTGTPGLKGVTCFKVSLKCFTSVIYFPGLAIVSYLWDLVNGNNPNFTGLTSAYVIQTLSPSQTLPCASRSPRGKPHTSPNPVFSVMTSQCHGYSGLPGKHWCLTKMVLTFPQLPRSFLDRLLPDSSPLICPFLRAFALEKLLL